MTATSYRKRSEIVIVGGGISGLYVAWRLAQAGRRDVVLLEASRWFGGRIHSVAVPGTRIVAELGAMRFTKDHKLLWKLIDGLGLSTSVTEFNFPGTSQYLLRGKKFSSKEFSSQKLYNVAQPRGTAAEIPKTPDRLVNCALAQALLDIDFDDAVDEAERRRLRILLMNQNQLIMNKLISTSDEFRPDWSLITKSDWNTIKSNGLVNLDIGQGHRTAIKLSGTGFWNLLEYYLGGEGFQLIHDALGYESLVSNWNSAEAIPWFISDFTTAQYFTLIGGMGTIVTRLEAELDGQLITNAKATEIKKLDAEGSHWLVTYSDGKVTRSIHTEHVVLAIPRRPLEDIAVTYGGANDLGWTDVRRNKLRSVHRNKLFKVFLIFDTEWWNQPPFTSHPTSNPEGERRITDLPIRQIYYYGRDWIEKHQAPVNLNEEETPRSWTMIMASYSDSHYVYFWRPFIRRRGDQHDGILRLGENDESLRARLEPLVRDLGVPPRMAEKIRRQLAELHGVETEDIPEPIMGLYVNWGYEPDIRAGWHSWQVEINAQKVADELARPLPGSNLYICGEAYSGNQGWIDGALQTAEIVLSALDLEKSAEISGDALHL